MKNRSDVFRVKWSGVRAPVNRAVCVGLPDFENGFIMKVQKSTLTLTLPAEHSC